MRRLEGINRTESRRGLNQDLRDLQKELWNELEMILTQDSLIWAQKARGE